MNAVRLTTRIFRVLALLAALLSSGLAAAALSSKLDLDGDGKSDILWYNASTGMTSTWVMNGASSSAQAVLLTHPDWKIIGTPDFNGDGKSDLLWYNAVTGQTSTWLMNGTSIVSTALLLTDPNWKVIATADFNGDGKADLLWYNVPTGQTAIWLMNAATPIAQTLLLTDPNWKVIGTPDLNGDGKADLLWYNAATGQTSTWLMNGTAATSASVLLTDANWKGTADLNGDGKADLLWYNAATGQTSAWLMNGSTFISAAVLMADSNSQIVAVADLNGDGRADILWYNKATSTVSAWLMNGTSATANADLLTDLNWKVLGTLDLNGDGKSDILWYNAATGQTSTWLMDGLSETSGVLLLTDPQWVSSSVSTLPLLSVTPPGVLGAYAGNPNQAAPVTGSSDGVGSAARFNGITGMAIDPQGNLFVVDQQNQTIRKIAPGAIVSTLAGTVGVRGSVNGTGSAAQFDNPFGVVVDASGNLFVTEVFNHTIRKITPAGLVSTFAGSPGVSGNINGTASAARFSSPKGIAIDRAGSLFVADQGNGAIRKITPDGVVTTLAGGAGGGYADGTGLAAKFNGVEQIAIDSSGTLYVTDFANLLVRKVTQAGVVTTFAGTVGVQGSSDGVGTAAKFFIPHGIAVDSAGNVYVADSPNYTIRKITPFGVVSTIAGVVGHPEFVAGPLPGKLQPFALALTGRTLYVSSTGVAVITNLP